MDKDQQRAITEEFSRLHSGERPLVLPNAWDAASAKVIEMAGFPAIATGSAGVAAALGYPDREKAPRQEVLEAVNRILRVVSTPVSADLEKGYGQSPDEVAETIRLFLEAGVVGGNLEDSTQDQQHPFEEISIHCAKLRAARKAAEEAGIPMYINARVDGIDNSTDINSDTYLEAIRRANAYLEAGANGIFYVHVNTPNLIARLVKDTPAPVNILAGPGAPTVAELDQLGVKRISFGPYLMRATMALTKRIAEEIRQFGTYHLMEQDEFNYVQVNRMFEREAG